MFWKFWSLWYFLWSLWVFSPSFFLISMNYLVLFVLLFGSRISRKWPCFVLIFFGSVAGVLWFTIASSLIFYLLAFCSPFCSGCNMMVLGKNTQGIGLTDIVNALFDAKQLYYLNLVFYILALQVNPMAHFCWITYRIRCLK